GAEIAIWPALCVGAAGNTATAASALPGVFRAVWRASRERELERGQELYARMAPLREAYRTAGGQAAVVKRLCELVGLAGGPPRPPTRRAPHVAALPQKARQLCVEAFQDRRIGLGRGVHERLDHERSHVLDGLLPVVRNGGVDPGDQLDVLRSPSGLLGPGPHSFGGELQLLLRHVRGDHRAVRDLASELEVHRASGRDEYRDVRPDVESQLRARELE